MKFKLHQLTDSWWTYNNFMYIQVLARGKKDIALSPGRVTAYIIRHQRLLKNFTPVFPVSPTCQVLLSKSPYKETDFLPRKKLPKLLRKLISYWLNAFCQERAYYLIYAFHIYLFSTCSFEVSISLWIEYNIILPSWSSQHMIRYNKNSCSTA